MPASLALGMALGVPCRQVEQSRAMTGGEIADGTPHREGHDG
ncbi:MAG: hypothetical protein AAEJ04_05880 [Planctomycetota bacterium]